MKDKYLLPAILFSRVSGDVMECSSLDLPLGGTYAYFRKTRFSFFKRLLIHSYMSLCASDPLELKSLTAGSHLMGWWYQTQVLSKSSKHSTSEICLQSLEFSYAYSLVSLFLHHQTLTQSPSKAVLRLIETSIGLFDAHCGLVLLLHKGCNEHLHLFIVVFC